MAPKKVEDPSRDPTANVTQISLKDFLETRNTVVTGLNTLQSAISDLSRSYLNHTDNLIGNRAGASLNFGNILGQDNGFFSARGPTPLPAMDAPPETKKRKRAPHDKNAPKRALTPFFLYLQSARPAIAEEMGSGHTAKEVQDEGGRRWREMPAEDKEVWTTQYLINFARYKERMKAYKAGLPVPEISDEEARQLYEANKDSTHAATSVPTETTSAVVADDASESSVSSTSSEDESPSPPPKEPSPTPAKRQKVNKDTSKRKALAAEPEPVLDPQLRAPEKKRSGKKAKAAAPDTLKPDIPVVSPTKSNEKQKKKKKKSANAE